MRIVPERLEECFGESLERLEPVKVYVDDQTQTQIAGVLSAGALSV